MIRRTTAIAVVIVLGCSGNSTGPNTHGVADVVMTPDTLTIAIGDSATVQAQPVNASGAPVDGVSLFWSTSDANVASVDQSGHVKAVGLGNANVDASVAGVSPKHPARVFVVTAPVAKISIAPTSVTLRVGGAFQFTDTTKDAAGNVVTGRTVVWSSSDTTVAPVDQAGLVLAKKRGSATITVSAGSASATATVTVSKVPVHNIIIAPSNPTVIAGEKTQLTATPQDSSGNVLGNVTITWTSSDTTTATIDQTGLATGKKPGSVTITASASGVSATTTLAVEPVPTNSVTLSPQSSNLRVGQTVTLTAVVTDNSGNPVPNATVAFSSGAPTVATVASTGALTATVTAVGPGQVQITGTSGGRSGTATINVSQVPVGSVTVSPAAPTVTLGATVQLTATVKDTAGNVLTGRTVTWATLNSGVATVSSTGLVTGVGAGSTGITASSGGQSGLATVTVTTVPIGSVKISPKRDTVTVGGQRQLAVTVTDVNGHKVPNPTVTWTSSNPGIAFVSSTGLVQGVQPGTASIIAQSGSKADTNTTTVAQASVASVSVSIASRTISAGQTTIVTAISKDAGGNVLSGRAVTWSTNKAAVATVSAGGIDPSTQLDTATVTGVAGGSATIIATSSNTVSGNVSVKVTSAVSRIVLTPNQFSLKTHGTQQVNAQALDANGHGVGGVTFQWTTKSGGAITSVNQSGLVTAVAVGSDSVFASAVGVTGGAGVTVTQAPVNTVIVTPPNDTITNQDNSSVQLAATLLDAQGDTLVGPAVTWQSDHPDIAVVSASGLVTPADGGAHGRANITATSQGKHGSTSVTVIDHNAPRVSSARDTGQSPTR